MAKQDTTTSEQQRERDQSQGQQGQDVARRSQQQGLARGGRDPFGMMLSPADLLRMNPFALMRRMTEEMDRVLGEVASGRRGNGPMVWAPAIEVEKRGDNCVIRAELPGLKPEDVKLEVTDGAIIIEGERKEEQEENREGARMSERRYGYFYRSIPLPEGADPEKARAKFENGMLEIAVPVQKQEEQRRRIPIESAEKAEKANRAA